LTAYTSETVPKEKAHAWVGAKFLAALVQSRPFGNTSRVNCDCVAPGSAAFMPLQCGHVIPMEYFVVNGMLER